MKHSAVLSLFMGSERLLMLIILTVITHFGLVAHAGDRMQLYQAAKSFVSSNSIDVVFAYLERTIPTNAQPTFDSPLLPEDVLFHSPTNLDFSPKHLPRFLELAEMQINRSEPTADARISAFEQFIRHSIIFSLRADQRSVAVAEELNHEMGERFDKALVNWHRLSSAEREMEARLLGDIALQSAEPEYLARVMMFSQMATVREFVVFNGSLSSSSGALMATKAAPAGRYAEMINGNPGHQFSEWMKRSMPVIGRLWTAAQAVLIDDDLDFGDGKGYRRTLPAVNGWIKAITTDGTRRFIEQTIATLESKMPLVNLPTSTGSLAFVELLHSSEFKLSLVRALDRFPELSQRIQAIQARTVEIDRRIGKIRLNRIAQDNANAAAQMRLALGIGTCRDLFHRY
jgi:hypothetical protein